MIYTGLLSLLLAEYAANQKCSAVLLCSADSIYPRMVSYRRIRYAGFQKQVYFNTVKVLEFSRFVTP